MVGLFGLERFVFGCVFIFISLSVLLLSALLVASHDSSVPSLFFHEQGPNRRKGERGN